MINSSTGIDLSIIILSYKSKNDLQVLLPSISASRTHYTYEMIIVDNGSNDGTAAWLEANYTTSPKLDGRHELGYSRFIQNVNNGFAAGNNLGIKQAQGRYILILNPDTKLEPDTLETMLDFMESRPDVGVAGCKIIKADGTLDAACRRRFPNPWNSFARLFLGRRKDYNYADIDAGKEMEVESVVGAFMMIRRQALEKIGLLDESFFMYGEDLDYCWRAKQAGYKVWYYPKTFITHYKGSSSAKVSARALGWFYDAMWIFYKKYYFQKYPKIFSAVVWLGIKLRFWAVVFINAFKKEPRVSH